MPAVHQIAFWNVENLFDVETSPRRSEKLQRRLRNELAGWDDEVLATKLTQLASIIGQMNEGRGPDLLGVCEVENEEVLQRLLGSLQPLGRNYRIAHADTADGRGIDVAFIFDAERFEAREQFAHAILKRTATRDLFQVNFGLRSGRELIVVGNHWPSRRGGQYESEPYRMLAGETLAYFHERILEIKGENVALIAMGDFNDEPFDRALVHYALSNRQTQKVLNARSARFLNLMWPALGERAGTHYYNNVPNMLDQFLVSRGLIDPDQGVSVVAGSTRIEAYPEMTGDGAYPAPIRFGRPSSSFNPAGFSDHFPISCRIAEA